MECAECGADLADNAFFCSKCGTSVERYGEELKDVSVLFAHLEGFTDFSEGFPPDELAELTEICVSALDTSVKRFGGTVGKRVSDGLMALFSAPVRREKDAEMAVRTGLDMIESFGPINDEVESRTGRRLGVRVGIATGHIRFERVGSDDEYTATGEVVNLAKKIEEGGGAGLCLINEDTYGLIKELFKCETWQGAPSDMVWVVKERKEVLGVLKSVELVNRSEEKKAIVGTLETLKSGNPVTISLVGPAGVGKSAIISSVLNEIEADSYNTFVCEGNLYTQKAPFYAWVKNISKLFNRTETSYDNVSIFDLKTDDDWGPFVAEMFGAKAGPTDAFEKIEPETRRDIALQLVSKRICEKTTDEPVFLVVENAQWLDSSSLDLVKYIVANSTEKPVAVIVAARDEDPVRCDKVFDIKPLGDGDARELLLRNAEVLTEKPDFVDKAVGLASGNVYYLREIAKSVERAGTAFNDKKIPSSARGMVRECFDNLGGVVPAVVKTASVLEENEFEEALGCLYADGILERENGRVGFANVLDQEIALGMVERKDQVAINEAAAEALAGFGESLTAERASRIARHYINAANKPKAIDYLRKAGLAAYRAFDIDAAKYFLEQARSICIEGGLTDKQIDVTLELANVIRNKADLERALSMLRGDFSLIVDEEVKGDYLIAQGNLLARLERIEEAETHLTSAAGYFEKTGADGKRAKALISVARVKALMGRYEEALSGIEESRVFLEGIDDKDGKADAHNLAGFIYCVEERYNEAAVEYEAAYELWKEIGYVDGVTMALNNLAGIRSAQGDFEIAVKNLNELLRFARLSGDKYTESVSLMNISYAYYKVGNLKAAEGYFNKAKELINRAVFDDIKNTNLSYGAVIKMAQGRYDEALELIEEFRASEVAGTLEQLTELFKIYELEINSKLGILTGEEFMAEARRTAPELDKQALSGLRADFYTAITEGYIHFGMLDEAERAFDSLTAFVGGGEDESTDVAGYALLEVKLLLARGEYAAAGKKAAAAYKNVKEKSDYRYMAESLLLLSRALYTAEDGRWRSYAVEAVKLFDQLGAEPLSMKLKEELGL
jgi:class 3 adenylate cyclase/tetratricopeptide (TPR) repeat protein